MLSGTPSTTDWFTMAASKAVPDPEGSPTAQIQVTTVTIMSPLAPNWPLFQTLLSVLPPCFLASGSKFLDSYYPLSFIYCPWVLLGLPIEWPLDSDLPLQPHHNHSLQVLITSCLDWFISKFSSSLFTPQMLPLFVCHILIKIMLSYHCTATIPLEIPSALTTSPI